jgi:Protein of unknown function (DUF3800)
MTWKPQPHEADLFYKVFVDESSQTKSRYLVLGGLTVPLDKADAFEAHIIAARDPVIAPLDDAGEPRVIKWEKVKNRNVGAYTKVIDAFFGALTACKVPVGERIDVHCLVVDTRKRDLRKTDDGDVDIGFNKQLYFLCSVMIRERHKQALFRVYPDRRTTSHSLTEAKNIMNHGARKHGAKGWPFRHLEFEDPEKCQALQVVDIVIGALAYRLNGHYQKTEANSGKKALCDYIFKRGRIIDPLKNTPYGWRIAVWHRDTVGATTPRR